MGKRYGKHLTIHGKYPAIYILIASAALILITAAVLTIYFRSSPKGSLVYTAKVDGSYFLTSVNGAWNKKIIKGVNMGSGKPGSFAGEYAITGKEYLRWLKYIAGMNANTVRVYTIMNPAFYEALYEYNRSASEPIYLLQGVWVNEDDMLKTKNAFSGKVKNRFIKDIRDAVDVIHGNCVLREEPGYASGRYKADVSQYVIGWILGVEWDTYFIQGTNEINAGKTDYNGRYLYTHGASPFETWIAEAGDSAIEYETRKYNTQRPLSFVNRPSTDMLVHPDEPYTYDVSPVRSPDDMSVFNMELIKAKEGFIPGLFATYHIYPYYPEFMNFQKEYAAFRDRDGKINTYRAYLKDLRKEHKMPVLVGEFGVPSSRGIGRTNILMGFNQGNLDEKTQGTMDAFMFANICEEDYAGGVLFSWQDEWFRVSSNTWGTDIPDRRPYWSNAQSDGQFFGMLAFDPGDRKSICYADGVTSEWKGCKALTAGENASLYAMSDEKYIYLLTRIKGYDVKNDILLIPVQTTQNQGSTRIAEYDLNFKKPADFVVVINGKDNSRVMTDAYYDIFYYKYWKYKMVARDANFETKNSGVFNRIYQCTKLQLYLPEEKIILPLAKYETGKLRQGDANPAHKSFDSLTDFAVNGDNIEIRIPWSLFNVMDPSSKMVAGDLHGKDIKPVYTKGFYIGAALIRNGSMIENDGMNLYSWIEWQVPQYHERLKPSYYIMKEAFGKVR